MSLLELDVLMVVHMLAVGALNEVQRAIGAFNEV